MVTSGEAEQQPKATEIHAAQEREHAAAPRKRSRNLIRVLAVISVLSVIAAVVGFVQASQARHEKDRMFREAKPRSPPTASPHRGRGDLL
ncbi:MAG TPA: hypothetical protein VET27_00735 [Mycobacterium sp.]|nr:hypothetical protein [Mycobacterium sp.]